MDRQSIKEPRKMGRPTVDEEKKLMGVYVDPNTKSRIHEIAKQKKRSVSSLLGMIVDEWLSNLKSIQA
jgi:hypothetical protein